MAGGDQENKTEDDSMMTGAKSRGGLPGAEENKVLTKYQN